MGLVADVQRAEAQRRLAAGDGLAGGAEVAVAEVRAQPAQLLEIESPAKREVPQVKFT